MHGDDEAELVDKLGRARASRSCDTVANSVQTTDLACIAPWSTPTSHTLVVNYVPNIVYNVVLPNVIKTEVMAHAEV